MTDLGFVVTAPENPREHIGANNPPSDVELLQARLREEFRTDVADRLLNRAGMIIEIATEGDLEIVIDLLSAMRGQFKELDEERKKQNRPFDALIDAVNGYFRTTTGKLGTEGKRLADLQTKYLISKAAAERARKEAEAAAAAAEAKRLREEADLQRRYAETAADTLQAETTAQVADGMAGFAQQRTDEAGAKSADLARTRTTSGKLATLVEKLDFEFDRNKVDLSMLASHFDETAIATAIDRYKNLNKATIEKMTRDPASGGYRALPGVTFMIKITSSNRR